MRGFRLGLALAAAFLAMSAPAFACSCMMRASCGVARAGDVMFVGKVVTNSEITRPEGQYSVRRRLVRIEVTESFDDAAKVGDTVTVSTGMGGGDCGYYFATGQTYLIDAYRDKGELNTGICSETAPAQQAAALISELRAVAKGLRLPNLSGMIYRGGPGRNAISGMGGVGITVVSDTGVRRHGRTNPDGTYAWASLPPGTYTLTADLPPNVTTWENEQKQPVSVTIPAGNGSETVCHASLHVLPGGRITGIVDVGSARRLTAFVHARAAVPDLSGEYADSSDQVDVTNGKFDLRYLPAGEYVLEFATGIGYRDRWYYPGVKSVGEARTVHVDDGKPTEITFVAK